MDEHAQEEIRVYAKVIGEEIVKPWCPIAWEAFLDFSLHSFGFSRLEHFILKEVIAGNSDRAIQLAIEFGLLPDDLTQIKKNRERAELEAKLCQLGLNIPWQPK